MTFSRNSRTPNPDPWTPYPRTWTPGPLDPWTPEPLTSGPLTFFLLKESCSSSGSGSKPSNLRHLDPKPDPKEGFGSNPRNLHALDTKHP